MVAITMRELIRRYVLANPGQTATQIANAIKRHKGSVSGIIHDMRGRNEIEIDPDHKGPAGGVCYRIPRETEDATADPPPTVMPDRVE